MKINCIFCHTPVAIKDNNIKMMCICDDDFRIAPIDAIKYGFFKDKVYLLEVKDSSLIYEKSSNITK